jgi:hypothetical protein
MSRVAALLVGVSLSVALLGGGSSPLVEESQASAVIPFAVEKCPTMRREARDPINGRNCVGGSQGILANWGLDQPVTGYFGKITEANVKEFQRSEGIPATGIIGPLTRKALAAYASSDPPPIPNIPRSSFSTGRCTGLQCNIYLSRSFTGELAGTVKKHPEATRGVASAIVGAACKVFKRTVVSVVCEVVSGVYAKRLKPALLDAADQNACLHIVLKPARPPLSFGVDNSSRCED